MRKFNHSKHDILEAIGISEGDAEKARVKIITTLASSNNGQSFNMSKITKCLYEMAKKDDDALLLMTMYFARMKGEKVVRILEPE